MQHAAQTWPGVGRARLAAVAARLSWPRRWRLALLALAVALQTLLEIAWTAIGLPSGLAAALTFAALASSLGLLVAVVVAPDVAPAPWRRIVVAGALAVTLALGAVGVVQTAKALVASAVPTVYNNDGTTLDQYAAVVLLQGRNPYTSSGIVAALRSLGQDGQFTTPLRAGPLAHQPWTRYPTAAERRALATAAATSPTGAAPALESRVSYPAFAFLPLVPFALLGLPSVIGYAALSLAVFAVCALRAVAPELRPWLALAILADIPVLNATLAGALDVTVMTLVFLAWLWWERAPLASTVALGLALATKQQAWFFALFFGIFLVQRLGLAAAARRFAGAAGIFAALNLPFILLDGHAWLAGVLAPLLDPMFPLGHGLVGGALAGWLPLWPQGVYSVLEIVALAAGAVWYWRIGARRYPLLGLALAMAPLWFAWRSLTTYFDFIALPLAALWLAGCVTAATPSATAPTGDAPAKIALVERLT